MTFLPSTIDEAVEAISRVPRDAPVLVTCHVNPDGDAIGSMLGFALGLRRLGFTTIVASFPEPFVLADIFSFLPGLDLLVAPDQVPAKPELGISFDAAADTRLGELVVPLEAAQHWIAVDHHASFTGFGDIQVVDPSAAATALVAARLLDALGVSLDEDIATCLYVGLATDTGSFKFDLTTPEVFRLAARLVEAGARPAEIARRVFDTRPFAAIEMLTSVLGRVALDRAAGGGRGMISTYVTLADLAEHGLAAPVIESYMDVIRTAAEADVACLVKPAAPGKWAVSLRSKGGTDVSAIAVALGGGGHRLAAGFSMFAEVAEVLAAVRRELDALPLASL